MKRLATFASCAHAGSRPQRASVASFEVTMGTSCVGARLNFGCHGGARSRPSSRSSCFSETPRDDPYVQFAVATTSPPRFFCSDASAPTTSVYTSSPSAP